MENKQKIDIVWVDIKELKSSEYNPRKLSEKAKQDLVQSIIGFGLVDPIIANNAPDRKNIIIGGHQRFFVAKELGFKEVPVVYVNIPELVKEQELNLRLNKNMGEWDWNLLGNFDENLLLGVGFNDEELMLGFGLEDVNKTEIDEDRFGVLTVLPPESPKIKEKLEIHCDTIEEYLDLKKGFESGKINKSLLMEML